MWCKMLLSIVLVLNLVGCATSKKDMQIQQLQMRVSELNKQLAQKEREIYELENMLKEPRREKLANNTIANSALAKKLDTSKPTPKLIQSALKKAGFYDGPIDGKLGEKTKMSIKEFQRNNGLITDGVVGKQTWLKLRKYLN